MECLQENAFIKKAHKCGERFDSTSKMPPQRTRCLKSKAYVAFLNRIATYKRDLDLLDMLSRPCNVPSNVDKCKYTSFSEISMEQKDVFKYINHFKSTVHEGLIKNIYELMMVYFRSIIESILKHGVDPVRVLGDCTDQLELSSIVKAGSWDALSDELARIILRKLESLKNTTKLTEALTKRLSIKVDVHWLDAAKPYFEMRHLLVHNNGIPDKNFRNNYPNLIAKDGLEIKYKGVKSAIDAIGKYVKEFDKALIAKKILSDEDCQR